MDAESRRLRRSSSRAADADEDEVEDVTKKRKDKNSESSLQLLASRFIQFMEKQPHQSADIPTICAGLDIPKRRIYDVTNVLEGVGFLVRIGRNAYKWRGYQEQETVRSAFDAEEVAAKCADYRKQLVALEEESLALDEAIATISSRISGMLRDPEMKEYAYLHQSELQELPCVRDRVAVAVEYPMDSTLHFTMPAPGVYHMVASRVDLARILTTPAGAMKKRYDLFVHAESGKVQVRMLSGVGSLAEVSALPPLPEVQAGNDATASAPVTNGSDEEGNGSVPIAKRAARRKRRRSTPGSKAALPEEDDVNDAADDPERYMPDDDVVEYSYGTEFGDFDYQHDYVVGWQNYASGSYGPASLRNYRIDDEVSADEDVEEHDDGLYGGTFDSSYIHRYKAVAEPREPVTGHKRRGISDGVGKAKVVSFASAEHGNKRGRRQQDASDSEQERVQPASKSRRTLSRSSRGSRVDDDELEASAPLQTTRSGRAPKSKTFS